MLRYISLTSHVSFLLFSLFFISYLCRCVAGRTFSELEYPWRLIYNTRRSVVVALRHSRWDLAAMIAITYKIWTSIQCRSSWMMSWDTLVSQRIGGRVIRKMLFFWYQREIEFSALNNAKSSAFVLSARYSRACSVLDRVSFSSYSFYSIHSFPSFLSLSQIPQIFYWITFRADQIEFPSIIFEIY